MEGLKAKIKRIWDEIDTTLCKNRQKTWKIDSSVGLVVVASGPITKYTKPWHFVLADVAVLGF